MHMYTYDQYMLVVISSISPAERKADIRAQEADSEFELWIDGLTTSAGRSEHKDNIALMGSSPDAVQAHHKSP